MTAPAFWHMGGGLYTAVDGCAEIVSIEDARDLAADLGHYANAERDPSRRRAIAQTAVSLYAAITERARWMQCAGWPLHAIEGRRADGIGADASDLWETTSPAPGHASREGWA